MDMMASARVNYPLSSAGSESETVKGSEFSVLLVT